MDLVASHRRIARSTSARCGLVLVPAQYINPLSSCEATGCSCLWNPNKVSSPRNRRSCSTPRKVPWREISFAAALWRSSTHSLRWKRTQPTRFRPRTCAPLGIANTLPPLKLQGSWIGRPSWNSYNWFRISPKTAARYTTGTSLSAS